MIQYVNMMKIVIYTFLVFNLLLRAVGIGVSPVFYSRPGTGPATTGEFRANAFDNSFVIS